MAFKLFGRRKRRAGRKGFFLGNFYINVGAQYTTIIVSAILLSGFIFSGVLLFRYADHDDLISQGKNQLREGKVAMAVHTFQSVVNRYHDSYDGHLMLGKAYLELGQRRKAEQEFRLASTLRKTKDYKNSAAEIAQSKLLISQNNFEDAEALLLDNWKTNANDSNLKTALMELYERWGNRLLNAEETPEYQKAIEKYEIALDYCQDYESEDEIKSRLVDTIDTYVEELDKEEQHEESVKLLEKSLQYRYLPETLVQIAEHYEKSKKLDEAIDWYRKAFDSNPSLISIKLSNMLIKKGRQLLDEKKTEEAEKYFAEADQISKKAKISQEVLYPIEVSKLSISSEYDHVTGEFEPIVDVTFQNKSHRPLNFLVGKIMFYAGDKVIAEKRISVASPEKGLTREGSAKSKASFTVRPGKKLNVYTFKDTGIRVKVAVAYNEQDDPEWHTKAIQDVRIQSDHMNKLIEPELEEEPEISQPV